MILHSYSNFSGMLFLVWILISSSSCYCSNDVWCFKKEVYSCLACMLLSLWIFLSHSSQKLTLLKNVCWPEIGKLGHTDQACWLTVSEKKKKYIASHTHLFPCCQWVLSHPSVKYLHLRLGSLKYLALYWKRDMKRKEPPRVACLLYLPIEFLS